MQAKCWLQRLYFLNLNINRLHGSLPLSWSSFSELKDVSLAYNAFTGSVPATWSNWSQVTEIAYLLMLLVAKLDSHNLVLLCADYSTFAGRQSAFWDRSLHAKNQSA